jgi:cell division septum initiation protein DivIVA
VTKLQEEEKMRQDANKDLEQLARKDQNLTERIKELEAEITHTNEQLKRFQLAVQASKTKLDELLAQNPWINNEKEFFGVVGHKYQFEKINIGKLKQDVKQLQQDNEELKKRINRNVDAMFDKVET